jgi:transcriptional regulator with XRE-family HTH domain
LLLGEHTTKMKPVSRSGALETLGDLLRLARQGGGTSLIEMARVAGVSKGHLSHVENGRDRPSLRLVTLYEERFRADGQLLAAYLEVCMRPTSHPGARAKDRGGYPIAGDASEFITDVTVPDGLVVPPGFVFEKVWRIRNSGSVPWRGRWLARDGAPSGHAVPQSPRRVPIHDTDPGATVDIAVPLRAHQLDGTAQVRWKMVDDDDREYFPDRYYQGLLLTIVVRTGAPPPTVGRIA